MPTTKSSQIIRLNLILNKKESSLINIIHSYFKIAHLTSNVFSNFRQRALRDNVYRGFHLATLDTTLVEAELVHKGSEPLVYLCSTHDELAESERFRCSH